MIVNQAQLVCQCRLVIANGGMHLQMAPHVHKLIHMVVAYTLFCCEGVCLDSFEIALYCKEMEVKPFMFPGVFCVLLHRQRV